MRSHLARRTVLALAGAALLAAVPTIASASVLLGSGAPMAPRSPVVVAVSDQAHMASVRAALEKAGATVEQSFRWNALLVSAPAGVDASQFSTVARKVSGVRYAQGQVTYHALGTANDPLYPQQWGLPDIGAPAAWDKSEGSGVSVAIIDTGVDSTHPDLAGNVVLYKNYVTPSASAADDEGHGTHVAGIVGALRNNSLFGVGTAPKVKMYAFKVLDSTGAGSDSAIASALRDAVDYTPCRILSMSLGGPAGGGGDAILQDAVAYAQSKGAVVIAAAGNDGSTAVTYPAAINGVIGVGAVDSSNVLASFSNRGSADEDIVAPGVGILSTLPGSTSASWSGTSMATPFVSGAAALLWAAHPELSATQVSNLLLSTAKDLGAAGVDTLYGHGLVRPDLAIAAAGQTADTTPPTTTSDVAATYSGSATIHLTATDNAGGSGVAHTYYRLDGGTQTEGTTVSATGTGSHSLEFWSVDAAGNVESPHKTATFAISAPVPDTTPPTTASDAVATYTGSGTIHLTATDNAGGSGVAHTYYRLDGGSQVTGTSVAVSGTGSHTLEFWSVDAAGNVETPHKSVTFTVTAPPQIVASSVTIAASPTSVSLPRPFVLSGVLDPGKVGDLVVAYVKKPGSARWSYSSARGVYATTGASGGLWWYRYTPLLRGTYRFYARFSADATRQASQSRTISVAVR